MSFLPAPCPDPERCYGREQCDECDGTCYGHYRKLDDLWKFTSEGGDVEWRPPSEVILAEYNKVGKIPDYNKVRDVARQTLLPPEEVTM